MKLTSAQVKNLMRRGLRLLVDPEPEKTERQQIIDFFQHCCAYCGASVDAGKGDLDHLLSAAKGGRNHVSNRVFSCKTCNANEKRDKDWQEFLLEKHGSGEPLENRRRRILEWIREAGAAPPLSDALLEQIDIQIQRVTAVYDDACRKVRETAERDN